MTAVRTLIAVSFCASTLVACGGPIGNVQMRDSEGEYNTPLGEDPTAVTDPVPALRTHSFPPYSIASGIPLSAWNKAKDYYTANVQSLTNTRYVTIIDIGKPSNQRRFFLIDLETGEIEKFVTSHGSGSDPDNDYYATLFSNVSGSKKTSLGLYITGETYIGGNGRSLRLHGMESTNSNAFERLIVIHGANYVSEANSTSGRSSGCPALDHAVAQDVISMIKSGSLLLIEKL